VPCCCNLDELESACQGWAYRSSSAKVVPLDDIEPPFRTTRLDQNGFDRARMVSIQKASLPTRRFRRSTFSSYRRSLT
jgi:hypothetical protein